MPTKPCLPAVTYSSRSMIPAASHSSIVRHHLGVDERPEALAKQVVGLVVDRRHRPVSLAAQTVNSSRTPGARARRAAGPVEAALGDDHVGVALARLDEALVGRPNRRQVLLDHAARAVRPRSATSRWSRRIRRMSGGGVDEDLQVEPFAQRSVPQHEDAVDDDDLVGVHRAGLPAAIVFGVVVDRHLDRRAVGERRHVVVEQRPVERVRMVVVGLTGARRGPRRAVEVVRVEFDAGEMVFAGQFDQTLGDGGLARSCCRRRHRS